MNDQTNRQADRPRWLTPPDAVPIRATDELLSALAVGDVVEVPVRFGDAEEAVTLSLPKVSEGKFAVHTRQGFPLRCLVGAQVVRRVRRDRVETAEPVKPTGDGQAPVPTASRFHRRIVRPRPGHQRFTTVHDWGQLAPGELEAMPEGTRRAVALSPSVHLTLIRGAGGWTLNTRRAIPSEALAGLWTAPRVPVDADGTS
ncbi:hypothetical protein IN07_03750 [Modestobacter caceresii]|uniref:Uncharacterized protein n=1 Tax=Modestobacter caceresii TaxID=1522368 RepID=A0A098YEI9_9ACTN|nr:hypothetical protein [Modestobacter caceresii]KGH48176.1 hypothetical protein IN07_03750 [Modestobacter caceresii]